MSPIIYSDIDINLSNDATLVIAFKNVHRPIIIPNDSPHIDTKVTPASGL